MDKDDYECGKDMSRESDLFAQFLERYEHSVEEDMKKRN